MRCFVIGPIGAQNSDTRKNADRLFEHVIRPVLEIFSFDVIRADRISTVASITDEIIRLIQDSELCIIDLTEANPNVFYEAGRRHETGKPYIHLLHEGQITPFDVQGTRYVGYKDLSITDNAFEAQSLLKSFVEVIARTGFGASKSSNPLNNIEESLRRIEMRLTAVLSTTVSLPVEVRDVRPAVTYGLDPLRELQAAYQGGQYRNAETALLELEEIYVDKNQVLEWSGRLAKVGRRAAAELIQKYAMNPSFVNKMSGRAAVLAIPGLSRYFVVTGQAQTGKSTVLHLVDTVMSEAIFKDYTAEEQAIIANAAQSICYDVDDLENSQKYGELVCKLEPTEPIWAANLATTLFRRKDFLKASTTFDRARSLFDQGGTQIDMVCLETGAQIYAAVGQKNGVEHCLGLLKLQSPEREKLAREALSKLV